MNVGPGEEFPGGVLPETGEEIWECQIPGKVYVAVTSGRWGETKSVSVSGVGQKMRISTRDRVLNQELVVSAEVDPFRNGMLVRLDADQQQDSLTASRDALTNAALADIFNQYTGAEFKAAIEDLNEVNLRRMKEMCDEIDATASQQKVLDQLIARRYPIGKDSKTYRELKDANLVKEQQRA
jgi:hypothetical protein